MSLAPSLFDASSGSVLGPAADWLSGTLLGSVAISLCVIAIACVGLLLMTGRLAIRHAVQVVLGCFVLLGAPVIAAGLRGAADEASGSPVPREPIVAATPAPPPLPQSTFDPYAGASLRQN